MLKYVYIKRKLTDFGSNEKFKICSLKKIISGTEMNPDNQPYLNQHYLNKNRPGFFKISTIREKNLRSNINVTKQSPLNRLC